jgi:hypothetical protein
VATQKNTKPVKNTEPKKHVTIDGKDYFLDDLSESVKQQLGSIRATDIEIIRIEGLLSMLKTARTAYAQAVKSELEK